MSGSIWLLIFLCAFVGVLAGTMAYLKMYDEYLHHFKDKKEPRRIAFQSAIFTFIFFFLLSLGISYILTRFVL